MMELEPDKSLAFWVFTAAHAIERCLNDELAPLGITIRQVQILGALAVHGEVAQNQLAEALHVEPSSIVRLLDRMERDGWIVRAEDPGDRRRKIVRPTEKADPIWEKILSYGGRVKERALAGIPETDVEATRRTLASVRHNLLGDSIEGCPMLQSAVSSRSGFPG